MPVRYDQVSSPTSSRVQNVSDEFSWKHLCTKLMTTILRSVEIGLTLISAPDLLSGTQIKCHIFFRTVTFCLTVCPVCFANNRSIPSLLSATYLKDLTEPEAQRYFLLLHSLLSLQFRWCLIGLVLACRDSNTSLHKHEQFQRIICVNNTWFSSGGKNFCRLFIVS